MTCQNCKHWQLRQVHRSLAEAGFAPCALQKPWENWPAGHVCERLEVMAPGLVQAPVAWFGHLEKLRSV